MNSGRIILLAVALVAGGSVFFLMSSGGNQPVPTAQIIPQQDAIEVEQVLVADRDYARGDRLDVEGTRWVKWPANNLPEGAITKANEEFYETLPETVARSTLVKNEPITEAKILRPGQAGMMSALLTPGMRAVTLDVSMRQSAGGFILPGDRIDIFHTADSNDRDGTLTSQLLYANVRVLAIDQTFDQMGEGAQPSNTVTVELSPAQIEKFLTSRENGTLSLALRSAFQPEGGDELLQETQPSEVVVIRYGQS